MNGLPAMLYLHGFRSSPASVKATLLRTAIAALPARARPMLMVPELPHRPADAIASVQAIASACDPARLCFIGSSLGGFYATVAAEQCGARAVLINPAVHPDRDLRSHSGRQVNLHTGAAFDVTSAHFDELRAMRVARITRPERYFLLVQSGDEVLDYREAVAFYAGASQFVEGGGDHGFMRFETQLPSILRFCGVDEAGFVQRT